MITDNYIKMCEQAEEIQKEWKPKKGDFYSVIVHGKPTDIIDIYIDGFSSYPQRFVPLSALYIWLPTQEQLWDMLEGTILEKLDNFMANLTITVYETLQEHLLNHVMEHNWGKMWLNKKWEVI